MPRELCGTEIFDLDRCALILADVILRAWSSPVPMYSDGQMMLTVGHTYRHISPVSLWKWKTLSRTYARRFTEAEVVPWASIIFNADLECMILHHIATGRDGIVWLAIANYQYVAIKGYRRKDQVDYMAQEAALWKKIWDIEVCTLIPGMMIMPIVEIYSEQHMKVHKDRVQRCIERMAKHGYEHMDLKREHVAFFDVDSERVRTILIDLYEVKAVKKGDEAAVVKRMMDALYPNIKRDRDSDSDSDGPPTKIQKKK